MLILGWSSLTRGIAGAVLFWFDLQLDPTHRISNAPDSTDGLHWKQGLQFLPEVHVSAGMHLPLVARHNGSSLSFQWDREELNPDALPSLPRFDPLVWRQATELDEQTRRIMQHVLQDPAEYRRAAALAQRFAIDPAAHGIDPAIARLFAGMFCGI